MPRLVQNPHSSTFRAFTFLELIVVVAIIAALTTIGLFFVSNYIRDSKRIADQHTLQSLNDALTRYKCEGGDVNSLTAGAPIGNVLARLQTPLSWGGTTHQVMQSGVTYPARSLLAIGNKAQYHFGRYDTYVAEVPTAGTPTSEAPWGIGVGYVTNDGYSNFTLQITTTGAGFFAVKSGEGQALVYSSGATSDVPATEAAYATFWPCDENGVQQGDIVSITDNTGTLTSLDVQGMTGLTSLNCSWNYNLASLNVEGCTELTSLDCSFCYCSLTELNLQGLTKLNTLNCYADESLTSLNLEGCTALTTLSCGDIAVSSLELQNLPELVTVDCSYGWALSSLTLTNLPKLESLNCSNNTSLSTVAITNLPKLTTFDCSSSGLSSLNLQDCSALTSLNCSYNEYLDNLSIQGCTSLNTLYCGYTGLFSLNLAGLASLSTFDCSGCSSLTTLSVQGCTSLTSLSAYSFDSLTSLNAQGCTSLTGLDCNSNPNLISLDVSGYTALPSLACNDDNSLTTLNIQGCSGLINFYYNNISSLTTINAAGCTKLVLLDCTGLPLLASLDVSGCTSLTSLKLAGTEVGSSAENLDNLYAKLPSFSSGTHNLIFDAAAATAIGGSNYTTAIAKKWSLSPDPTFTYTYGVGVGYMAKASGTYSVTIDSSSGWVAYKNAAGVITYKASGSSGTLPASSSYTFWACAADGDSTLKGSLGSIACSGGSLTSLNIQGLISLGALYCERNLLTSLDASKNIELYDLYCGGNNLSSLTVSGLSALKNLSCYSNSLTILDINHLTALETVDCSTNSSLISISAQGCTKMKTLGSRNCISLNSLDVSGCTALASVSLTDSGIGSSSGYLNNLFATLPTFTSGSHILYFSGSAMTSLANSEYSTAIVKKWIINPNPLGDYPYNVGVGYMTKPSGTYSVCPWSDSGWVAFKSAAAVITYMNTDGNWIILPASPSYTFWACKANGDSTPSGSLKNFVSNGLTSLNVQGLTALSGIDCHDSYLTSLNISNCTGLQVLYCNNNQLTSLNLSDCKALARVDCFNNQLTSLDVSGCTELWGLKCYGNPALVGSTAAINAFYGTLPDVSGGVPNMLYLGNSAPSATDSIATNKGWGIYRSDN